MNLFIHAELQVNIHFNNFNTKLNCMQSHGAVNNISLICSQNSAYFTIRYAQ